MMSRPLSQILPPDLPSAGASPQFGNSSQAGGLHSNSTANLKSLLQLPVKADQRVKDCCEMKGEESTPDIDNPVSFMHLFNALCMCPLREADSHRANKFHSEKWHGNV